MTHTPFVKIDIFFTAKNRTTKAPNQRGYGKSSKPADGLYHINFLVADIASFVKQKGTIYIVSAQKMTEIFGPKFVISRNFVKWVNYWAD